MDILKKESFQSFSLVFALLLLAVCIQYNSFGFMKNASKEILTPLEEADSLQENALKFSIQDSTLKLKILCHQYHVSNYIKKYYKNLAVSYYINYYAFSICAILFTTLLTLAVFLVASKGWLNSSQLLKTFLLTTLMISSIYYFLPNVLNNKENFQKNSDKVKVFQKIQTDILIFLNTFNKNDKLKMDSTLTSNYNQIISNYEFITTIDNSKINSNPQDLIKTIKP